MRTLETEEIGKTYAGRQVVRGVSVQIAQGEVVGLLGPNGAGKTTSFYMIVGLVRPDTDVVDMYAVQVFVEIYTEVFMLKKTLVELILTAELRDIIPPTINFGRIYCYIVNRLIEKFYQPVVFCLSVVVYCHTYPIGCMRVGCCWVQPALHKLCSYGRASDIIKR